MERSKPDVQKRFSVCGILQVAVFCLLFFYLFSVVRGVLVEDYNRLMRTETPGTVDIAFMGASHVHRALFPMELYQTHGFTAITQSQAGQTMPLSYYSVREMIMRLKPKMIVLDVYFLFYGEKIAKMGYAHRTIDSMPMALKVECVRDLIPRNYWKEFLMPITLYHDRWQRLRKKDFVNILEVKSIVMMSQK